MKRKKMRNLREKGNVGDLMTFGVFVLFLAVLMIGFFNCLQMVQQKSEISQISRQYILRMETVGYLTEADKTGLETALKEVGVTNISLSGTTRSPAGYGKRIELRISGTIRGKYVVSQRRVSTAKC